MSESAFFQLYRDLDREGPGEPDDVAWAVAQAGTRVDAVICDAACGSGADIAPLLAACPDGYVVAIEKQPHFVKQAMQRYGDDPRIDLRVGDMRDIDGPYDLIWSAGAVYFLGITEALNMWRSALAAGGAVAFSQLCWWGEKRSAAAKAFWADYEAMPDVAGIEQAVSAAGYQTIATRRVSARAWEIYYGSLEARIKMLRPNADSELTGVLDESQAEIDIWRAHGDEFGYLLSVVQPS